MTNINTFPGNVGVGTSNPDFPLTIQETTTNTNTVTFPLALRALSSGTVDDGFGVGLRFQAERADTDNYQGLAGSVEVYGANIPGTSDLWNMRFGVRNNDTAVTPMTLKYNGNVGIGTSDPKDDLHIFEASGGQTTGLFIEKQNGASGTAQITFGVAADGEGAEGKPKGGIFFERTATNGLGEFHFCLDSNSDNNAVALSDVKMAIITNGNVGIGLTNPSTKLQISSGDVGIDRDQKFDFGAGYSANWYIKQKSADNKIYFERTGGPGNELVIDTAGNVGIGTATPRGKLNIAVGRLQVGSITTSNNTAVIGGGGATSRVARNNFLNVNCDFTFPRGFNIVSFGYINFHDSNIVNTQAINICSGNGPYRTVLAGSLSYIQISTLSSNTLRFRGVNLPSVYNDWALNHWYGGYVF